MPSDTCSLEECRAKNPDLTTLTLVRYRDEGAKFCSPLHAAAWLLRKGGVDEDEISALLIGLEP